MTALARLVPPPPGNDAPYRQDIATDYNFTIHANINTTVHEHWLALLERIETPSLFQHIAWCTAFLTCQYRSEEHGESVLVLIKSGDNPVAVVPLFFQRKKYLGLQPARVELMHPSDMGIRDLPVADGIHSDHLLEFVLKDVLPNAGYHWKIATFPDIAATSCADKSLKSLLSLRTISSYHHNSNRLQCSGDRNQPFANVSKSHVKKTKRKRKNLDQLGKIDFEWVNEKVALPQALQHFIELENAGWKGFAGEKTSLYHDLPQKRFYESMVHNSDSILNCCFAIMRLDGRPIAINLCTRTGDTLWMLKITHCDNLHEYSPGNLILLEIMEHFAGHQNIKYISFITGGDWTLRWHPEQLPVHNTQLYSASLAGFLFYLRDSAIDFARHCKHKLNAWKTKRAANAPEPQPEPN